MTLRKKSGEREGKKGKPQKIYLAEPHDYFGINYFLKMQERQRQLAKNGSLEPFRRGSGQGSCQLVNGIVPSKCWRAYDLHNKPRGLYSEEEKRVVALESSCYNKTAISIPVKEVIASKFKRFLTNSFRPSEGETEPLVRENSPSSETLLRNSCPVSQKHNPERKRYSLKRKQVHFSSDTIFYERNDNSSFRRDLLQRREQREMRKKSNEGLRENYSTPFLPYLESGLSYEDTGEFYYLKNSHAPNKPYPVLNREACNAQNDRFWCKLAKALSLKFCCMADEADDGFYRTYPASNAVQSYQRHHDQFFERKL